MLSQLSYAPVPTMRYSLKTEQCRSHKQTIVNALNFTSYFLCKESTSYQTKSPVNPHADAGYESEENYHYLEEKGICAYIKPSNYEYSKTRRFQREMEFRLSMEYDREKDEYTCRNGRKLRHSSNRSKESKTGYISTSRIYRCEDCTGCPYLGKCYKGKHTKSIQVSERFDQYREESLENITSEKGNILKIY